jgi:ABC-2 type transport system ATP-binding protein
VTLLLTTQYLDEADAVSDRVVLIDRGREVAAGTPAELKSRVGQQRVDVVAADAEAFAELQRVLGDRFDTTPVAEMRTISVAAPDEVSDLARVAEAIQRADVAVDEIALRRPTLDDAFLALTGHAATREPDDAESDNDPERTEVAA